MAARRIRVYELARELGLSNKETLDLCAALGIGVKSHSSSIEDAQADRVRRKAEAEGLKRDVQPEEPPKKAKKAAKAAAPAEPAAPPAAEPPVAEPAPASRDTSRPPDPTHRLITSRPASEQPDLSAPRPAVAPPRPAPSAHLLALDAVPAPPLHP